MNLNLDDFCVILLAAGKGTRINSSELRNKVSLKLNGKPLISWSIENIKGAGIKNIYTVVGFAKDSVINILSKDINLVEQDKQLGTAHAVKVALDHIPNTFKHILVLNGDDTYSLKPEFILGLIRRHTSNKNKITFITDILEDPQTFGRIIRDKKGNIQKIVEAKEATSGQLKINEVNIATYIFDAAFLKNNISQIKPSPTSSEYYLTELVETAISLNLPVEGITFPELKWMGINTAEDLQKASTL